MKVERARRKPTPAPKRNIGLDRRTMLMALIGGVGGAAVIGTALRVPQASAQTPGSGKTVTLYKEPQCGCCEGYADYLRSYGFVVNLVPTHDLPLLDEKYGIAEDLSPCHISLVDGYVVGGHIPIEVINRLLTERPAITGITLAGMPQGSPGMTGTKTAPFKIYEIAKGPRKVYAVV